MIALIPGAFSSADVHVILSCVLNHAVAGTWCLLHYKAEGTVYCSSRTACGPQKLVCALKKLGVTKSASTAP